MNFELRQRKEVIIVNLVMFVENIISRDEFVSFREQTSLVMMIFELKKTC